MRSVGSTFIVVCYAATYMIQHTLSWLLHGYTLVTLWLHIGYTMVTLWLLENNTHVWVAVADELPWHDFYCREIQIRY